MSAMKVKIVSTKIGYPVLEKFLNLVADKYRYNKIQSEYIHVVPIY